MVTHFYSKLTTKFVIEINYRGTESGRIKQTPFCGSIIVQRAMIVQMISRHVA